MNKSLDVYIAVPYSHDDLAIRIYRFLIATVYAAKQVELGHTIYSPITQSHPLVIAYPQLRSDWEFWKRQDQAIIPICAVLHVLQLPGWKESIGVTKEIHAFERLEKPIKLIGYNELIWAEKAVSSLKSEQLSIILAGSTDQGLMGNFASV